MSDTIGEVQRRMDEVAATATATSALQAVWDYGDERDSDDVRHAAVRVANRLGVEIRTHDFGNPADPPTGLRAAIERGSR